MRNRLSLFVAIFVPVVVGLAAHTSTSAQQTPAYLVIGDSIGFGIGASDPAAAGYAQRALESLQSSDRYRQRGLELVNLSVPGATSSDLVLPGGQLEMAVAEIQRRQREGASQGGVEVISVDIGANDLLGLVAADSPCISQAANDKQCLERLRDLLGNLQGNLTKVLRGLRAATPDATIVVVDLYNPYSGTGDVRETIADYGVAQVNGSIVAAAAAPDLNVRLASVYQLFLGRGSQWVAADGLHPNDSGHRVIAEVVAATIEGRTPAVPEDLLKEAPGPIAGRPNSEASGDGISWQLVAAVVVAFAAGVAVSSAYFVVRGRT